MNKTSELAAGFPNQGAYVVENLISVVSHDYHDICDGLPVSGLSLFELIVLI